MARFGRVVTAMVTPFKADGSLDVAEAQRLARHLIDHGSDGLVVCGSTGESATTTDDEKIALFRAIVDAVGGDAKVIAGTGTYSTDHSIHLTREAEKAGVDGALAVTPYYNRPPQDALLDHFLAIADCSNLPVMLYDVASRTATRIDAETTVSAAAHPNIVAMKDASNDLAHATMLAATMPDGFELYSGNDDQTLAYQAIGAVGVVSVLGHVMGELISEQFDAFERGDLARAREIQFLASRVQPALLVGNPIPIKAAVNMIGFNAGAPRQPLRAANAQESEAIKEALKTIGAFGEKF